ncbi:MAG: BON domain-containing protein [Betaproteobacteria bacterium]|nr:BON domain-containing protein [Betaproteobacteria bacterium]
MNKTKIFAAVCAAAAPFLLSGCPALLAAGAAGGAVVVNEKRTAGALVEDELIEDKALVRLHEKVGGAAHVGVTSYNRRVLLTGQAPNAEIRKQINEIIHGISNVRTIVDQMEVGNPSSLTARLSDSALTARVKVALCRIQTADFQAGGFSCLDVKVVTEKGVVYLLGLVSKAQAATAIDAARNLPGVIKVVKVFEYR